MNTTKGNTQQDKNMIGSVITGAVEVAAIAGVAVAATLALKDEKSRKKTGKMLNQAKDKTVKYIQTLNNNPDVKNLKRNIIKIGKSMTQDEIKVKKVKNN